MTRLRNLALIAAVFALSACDSGAQRGGQAQADAQTTAACRQRADEVYDTQNRAEIYSPQSSVNTPYSANYTPGISDRGLSQLFAHDKIVSDCIRNTGTGAERSQPPANQR
jgi:outer membrane biogenesis lipoprotein LolB